MSFETEVIKYLFQKPDAISYVPDIKLDIFKLTPNKIAFEALRQFSEKYKKAPSKGAFEAYVKKEANWTPEQVDSVMNQLVHVYQPIQDEAFVRDEILSWVKQERWTQVMIRYADKMQDPNQYPAMSAELAQIITLGVLEDKSPLSLTKDNLDVLRRSLNGHPTFLEGLNKTMNAGGFKAPELIGIMCPPKGFKTGSCINFAAGFIRSGLNVLYLDFENGRQNILMRFIQHFMEATYNEIKSGDLLSAQIDVMAMIERFGGKLWIDDMPIGTDWSVVEAYIKSLVAKGYQIDAIIYDYIPLMGFKGADQERLRIKRITEGAVNLNKELQIFAISPFQMNKLAVRKGQADMTDFAEAFALAGDLHSAFAMFFPDEDLETYAHIYPVFQREGIGMPQGINDVSKWKHCYPLTVDKGRQIIVERVEKLRDFRM